METVSTSPSAKSMRRKADDRRKRGWKRNSFWLTPSAIEVLDGARQRMKLDSREATINAILERIGTDVLLQQEFLAVTK